MATRISKEIYDHIRATRQKYPDMSVRELARKLGMGPDVVAKWVAQPYPEAKPFLAMPKLVTPEQVIKEELFAILSKNKTKKRTITELADQLETAPKKIQAAIAELQAEGKNVYVSDGVEILNIIEPTAATRIDVGKFKGRHVKFGLTSDNHLGSKSERMDVLNALFDIWAAQGIDTVYQCGNMIEGEARFNKFDLLVHGMEGQINYFVENWPARKGMTTKFITGDDHEGWYSQREHVDVGKVIQLYARNAGRTDLEYLGHMEHDIVFSAPKGKSVMRLIHAGGGTAYALSYKSQQIINSYQGGEKPNILLIGHYHKAEFNYWREVLNLMAGCTKDQDTFMRKLNIQAHVGGWTISFDIDDNGIVHGFTPQWHPFYDRNFYKTWKYSFK